MKRLFEENETLTQIVNDAGRPSRPDGFTNKPNISSNYHAKNHNGFYICCHINFSEISLLNVWHAFNKSVSVYE